MAGKGRGKGLAHNSQPAKSGSDSDEVGATGGAAIEGRADEVTDRPSRPQRSTAKAVVDYRDGADKAAPTPARKNPAPGAVDDGMSCSSSGSSDDSGGGEDEGGGQRRRCSGRGRGRGRGRGGFGGGRGRRRQRHNRQDSSEGGTGSDVEPEPDFIDVTIDRTDGLPAVKLSGAAFGDIVASYHILRAFSFQLRLSPFSLQELCAAIASGQSSSLLDEVHVCLLRALAVYEVAAERKLRRLGLEMLDQVTWPEFVWEWLEIWKGGHLLKARLQPVQRPTPSVIEFDDAADAAAALLPPPPPPPPPSATQLMSGWQGQQTTGGVHGGWTRLASSAAPSTYSYHPPATPLPTEGPSGELLPTVPEAFIPPRWGRAGRPPRAFYAAKAEAEAAHAAQVDEYEAAVAAAFGLSAAAAAAVVGRGGQLHSNLGLDVRVKGSNAATAVADAPDGGPVPTATTGALASEQAAAAAAAADIAMTDAEPAVPRSTAGPANDDLRATTASMASFVGTALGGPAARDGNVHVPEVGAAGGAAGTAPTGAGSSVPTDAMATVREAGTIGGSRAVPAACMPSSSTPGGPPPGKPELARVTGGNGGSANPALLDRDAEAAAAAAGVATACVTPPLQLPGTGGQVAIGMPTAVATPCSPLAPGVQAGAVPSPVCTPAAPDEAVREVTPTAEEGSNVASGMPAVDVEGAEAAAIEQGTGPTLDALRKHGASRSSGGRGRGRRGRRRGGTMTVVAAAPVRHTSDISSGAAKALPGSQAASEDDGSEGAAGAAAGPWPSPGQRRGGRSQKYPRTPASVSLLASASGGAATLALPPLPSPPPLRPPGQPRNRIAKTWPQRLKLEAGEDDMEDGSAASALPLTRKAAAAAAAAFYTLRELPDPALLLAGHNGDSLPTPNPVRPDCAVVLAAKEEGGPRLPLGSPYTLRGLKHRLLFSRPAPQRRVSEPSTLTPEQNAAILIRLCNDLLDTSPVIYELERREAEGFYHAGRGGVGGAWAMRSADERVDRARRLAAGDEDDGNTDACVLCAVGGNLICCDSCPAAYHLRCISESSRTIPQGEWQCPECRVGGRGEAAGLRVPVAGVTSHGSMAWAAYNTLFIGYRKGAVGEGAASSEPIAGMPMGLATSEAAAERLVGLRKPKRKAASEGPHESSVATLAEGPGSGCVPAAPGVETYSNRYRSSWVQYTSNHKAAVEAELKKMRRSGAAVAYPVPLPLSRFLWPASQGKGQRTFIRCGRCHHCMRPQMKKACLAPITRDSGDADGGGEGRAVAFVGKMGHLQNYLLKAERDLQGLLEDGWAGTAKDRRTGAAISGQEYRRLWIARVRLAESPSSLSRELTALEAALRRTQPIMVSGWDPTRRLPKAPAATRPMAAVAAGGTPQPGAPRQQRASRDTGVVRAIVKAARLPRSREQLAPAPEAPGVSPVDDSEPPAKKPRGLPLQQSSGGDGACQANPDAAAASEMGMDQGDTAVGDRAVSASAATSEPTTVAAVNGKEGGGVPAPCPEASVVEVAAAAPAGFTSLMQALPAPPTPAPVAVPLAAAKPPVLAPAQSSGVGSPQAGLIVSAEPVSELAAPGLPPDAVAAPRALPARGPAARAGCAGQLPGQQEGQGCSTWPGATGAGRAAPGATSAVQVQVPGTGATQEVPLAVPGQAGLKDPVQESSPPAAVVCPATVPVAGTLAEGGGKDSAPHASLSPMMMVMASQGMLICGGGHAAGGDTLAHTAPAPVMISASPGGKSDSEQQQQQEEDEEGGVEEDEEAEQTAEGPVRRAPRLARASAAVANAAFLRQLKGHGIIPGTEASAGRRPAGLRARRPEAGMARATRAAAGRRVEFVALEAQSEVTPEPVSEVGDGWEDDGDDDDNGDDSDYSHRGNGRRASSNYTWWRAPLQRTQALLYLPHAMARRLARRGGKTSLNKQGVKYQGDGQHLLTRRLQWIAVCEAASSTAQLGLQVRIFDDHVDWERLRRPASADASQFGSASIVARRPAQLPLQPPTPLHAPAARAGITPFVVGAPGTGAAAGTLPAPALPTAAPALQGSPPTKLPPKEAAVATVQTEAGPSVTSAAEAAAAAVAAAEAAARAVAGTFDYLVRYESACIGVAGHPPSGSGAPSPGQGVRPTEWLHESRLPLWLIKAYEERWRRDELGRSAAGVAAVAMAAVAAAGEETWSVREARSGAKGGRVAAAEEDTCEACGAVYGGRGSGRRPWVTCGCCARQFHGPCAGMTQDAMDALADGDEWQCRTGGEGLWSEAPAACPVGALGAAGGLRGACTQGRGPKRAVRRRIAVAAEGEADAPRPQRHMAQPRLERRVSRPSAAVFDAGLLYCLCHKPWDDSVEMVGCDGCDGWFHPACVGSTMESISGRDTWFCPTCTACAKRQALDRLRQEQEMLGVRLFDLRNLRMRAQLGGDGKPIFYTPTNKVGRPSANNESFDPMAILADLAHRQQGSGRGTPQPVEPVAARRSRAQATPANAPTQRGRRWRRHPSSDESEVESSGSEEESSGDVEFDDESEDDNMVGGGEQRVEEARGGRRRQQQPCVTQPNGGPAHKELLRKMLAKAAANMRAMQGLPPADGDAELVASWPGSPANASGSGAIAEPGAIGSVGRPTGLSLLHKQRGSPATAQSGDSGRDADNVRASATPQPEAEQATSAPRRPVPASDQEAGGRQGGRPGMRLPPLRQGGAAAAAAAAAASAGTSSDSSSRHSGHDADSTPSGDKGVPAQSTRRARVAAAAVAMAIWAPADWAARAAEVLRSLLEEEAAGPFSEPVPRNFPGYHKAIKRPMDLGTVLRQLRRTGHYTSPAGVMDDVGLVWANCRKFNQEGSEVVEAAREAEAIFRRLWSKAGLCPPLSSAPSAAGADDDAGPLAAAASAAGVGWAEKAGRVLDELLQMDEAADFAEPVPAGIRGYRAVVKSPMDLGTVRRKLQEDSYASWGQVLRDVCLVWSNCNAFNMRGSPIWRDCQACSKAFEALCTAAGLPLGQPPAAAGLAAPTAPAGDPTAALHASRGPPAAEAAAARAQAPAAPTTSTMPEAFQGLAAEWERKAGAVMRQLLRTEHAQPFSKPAAPAVAPGHSGTAIQPMDLGTVSHRLKQGSYSSWDQVLADVALVWSNCHDLNGDDSELAAAAHEAAGTFADLCLLADLPTGCGTSATPDPSASTVLAAAAAAAGLAAGRLGEGTAAACEDSAPADLGEPSRAADAPPATAPCRPSWVGAAMTPSMVASPGAFAACNESRAPVLSPRKEGAPAEPVVALQHRGSRQGLTAAGTAEPMAAVNANTTSSAAAEPSTADDAVVPEAMAEADCQPATAVPDATTSPQPADQQDRAAMHSGGSAGIVVDAERAAPEAAAVQGPPGDVEWGELSAPAGLRVTRSASATATTTRLTAKGRVCVARGSGEQQAPFALPPTTVVEDVRVAPRRGQPRSGRAPAASPPPASAPPTLLTCSDKGPGAGDGRAAPHRGQPRAGRTPALPSPLAAGVAKDAKHAADNGAATPHKGRPRAGRAAPPPPAALVEDVVGGVSATAPAALQRMQLRGAKATALTPVAAALDNSSGEAAGRESRSMVSAELSKRRRR